MAGLTQTGVVDDATLTKMTQLRCGVPDVLSEDNTNRKKRYALGGKKILFILNWECFRFCEIMAGLNINIEISFSESQQVT